MARHRSFEEKIQIVEYYLENGDMKTTAKLFDVHARTIHNWILMYQDKGPESLKVSRQHNAYSADFKGMIANEYLNTEISQRELARKYNIPSHETVRKWIVEYTEGKKLK